MSPNNKMIEVLLNIYEHELLQMFYISALKANQQKIDETEEHELREKLNRTRNDIITWTNTGELPKYETKVKGGIIGDPSKIKIEDIMSVSSHTYDKEYKYDELYKE